LVVKVLVARDRVKLGRRLVARARPRRRDGDELAGAARQPERAAESARLFFFLVLVAFVCVCVGAGLQVGTR
jgi:hypothetical protein